VVLVALLVGLGAAVTVTAAAGARRTSTSFERLQATTRNHDVLLLARDVRTGDIERIRAEPGVDGVGWARTFALVGPDGEFPTAVGPLDDGLFDAVERFHIVDGRLPNPDRPSEVVLGESLAHSAGLRTGDVLRFGAYTQHQIDTTPEDAETPAPHGPALGLRVVGISRSPSDLGLQSTAGGLIIMPRPFVQRFGPEIGSFEGAHSGVVLVRLRDGADGVDHFLPRLRAIFGDRPFDIDPAAVTIAGVQESIDVLAIGVLVFGGIACAAALVVLGLVIGREVSLVAAGQMALRDLGLARRMRTLAVAAPFLLAITAGAVVGALGAWAASPLLPFGIAGRAEPDPGLSFDAPLIGLGALAFAATLAVVAIVVAARDTRRLASETARSVRIARFTRVLETAGRRPATTIGVDMALGRRTRGRPVPVRSSMLGVAVAVAGITAAAVFSASLSSVLETPRAYGRDWDAQVTDARPDEETRPCARRATPLARPEVLAVARVCSVSTTLDGRAVGGVAITTLRGSIEPTVLEGHAPHRRDEIALGTATMETLGKGIGERVTAESPNDRVEYRIVGRVVVPSPADAQAIADGAVFTSAGLERLHDPGNVSSSSSLVVRFRPGVEPNAATRRLAALDGVDVLNESAPLEVERLRQVQRLPVLLAIFLGVLGVIALALLLVVSVQRRRIDLAVLKVVGFRQREFSVTLAAQATTVALIGLGVGLATGILAGAKAWRITADDVGVLDKADTPLLVLAGLAGLTLLVANAIAVFPARAAARTHAATVLQGK
jgi:putative ABC transport system permease protein